MITPPRVRRPSGRIVTLGPTLALACLIAAVVFLLSGCTPLGPTGPAPAPATTITFLGTGVPGPDGRVSRSGVVVIIDMTFAPGVGNVGTTYPHEWVDTLPFSHHQIADKGTVTSYLFTIHPTEPGQGVTCAILFNGDAAKPVDTMTAYYPKPAVCGGPPA